MASRCPKVSRQLFPPDGNDCLEAVSRAILRLLSNGWSREALAGELGCSTDTLDNARDAKRMMRFESIAMLGFKFSDEFQFIESLWSARALQPMTVVERLDLIEMHQAAIRREVA